MDMMKWMILGIGVVAVVAGAVVYYRRRRAALNQGFEQVKAMLVQVPAKKKHSFLLFMFRESAKAGKNNDINLMAKVNDPKYLELQLLQMSTILKDRSKVKDKKLKQALQMYDTYLMWEKSNASKPKSAA